MKNLRSTLAYLLILLLLLPTFVACATGADANTTTTAPSADTNAPTTTKAPETTTAEQAAFDALPDVKYNYTFRVLMRKGETWKTDLFAEAITGDVVNDAVFERNGIIKDRFGVTMQLIESSHSNYETDALNAIQANSDEYDVIVPHARAAFVYAERGYLVDYNTLTELDLDAAWWDQDARKSFTINDKLYMMTGDLAYSSLSASTGMVFNKALADKYNIPSLYETVEAGNWTFDELARLSEQYHDDLNGDTKMSYADDQFGYITYIWIGPMQVLYSGGGRLIERDADNAPIFALNTERNINVYEKFFNLLDQDYCYLEGNRDENKSKYDCRQIFSQGRALFCDSKLRDVEQFREMTDDFGIIPYPKFDAASEKYYTNVDSGTNLYIVPITNADLSRTAVVLEALAIKGRELVIPAYYEVALQTKYSRDDISAKMIDRIREGRVYDLGYYNQAMLGAAASAGYNHAGMNTRNYASTFKAYEKLAATMIKKAVANY